MGTKIFAIALVTLAGALAMAQTDTTSSTDLGSTPQSTYKSDVNNSNVNVYKTGDIGVGVLLGYPTGVDAKYWTDENNAVHAGLVWQNGNAAVLADWMYHFRGAMSNFTTSQAASNLTPYAGVGVIANIGSGNNFWNRDTGSVGIGGRVPLGLEFLPRGVPVGIYGEVVPGLVVAPSVFGFFEADLGGRYYF